MDINDLRLQQQTEVGDIMSTLKTVEINLIDVCNRSCSICPRSDPSIYSSTKGKISLNLIEKLAEDLSAIEYCGRISFVGFGEPLLYKELTTAISIIKNKVSKSKWIEVNTNGDYLTNDIVTALTNAGCSNLTVSMYDSDISAQLQNLIGDNKITLTVKHCYNPSNLFIVNRADILTQSSLLNVNRSCYLPFYKMFIDFNGDALICCNDWGRKGIIGNIHNTSIKDIWVSEKVSLYRSHLASGDRKNLVPCAFCNINGTKYGQSSFQLFSKKD